MPSRLAGVVLLLALVAVRPVVAGRQATPSARPLSVVARDTFALVRPPPPASRGPVAAIDDVAFLDAWHGFDVTAAANWALDGSGVGRIQGTSDGGTSWATVWQRGRTSLTWIGFAGAGHVVAAGVTFPPGAPQQAAAVPILVRSDDGGRTWHAFRPHVAVQWWRMADFEFVDSRVGFAYGDPGEYWLFPGPDAPALYRTEDGGLHWTPLARFSGPRDTPIASFDFVSARHGYGTGPDGRRWCAYETADAGTHWRRLPSSCRNFELMSIQFVDARTGFAGGGLPYYATDHAFQALLVTHDGGRTWSTIYRGATEDLPIVRLRMADPTHGLAVTGGCKTGENSPCPGAVLATTDGGRMWHDTGQTAGQVAIAGPGAWVVPSTEAGSDVIWKTSDGGRTWAVLAKSGNVQFTSIAAAGSWLFADGEGGTYRSLDGGRTWRAFARPAPAGTQPWETRTDRPGLDAIVELDRLEVSHDAGRHWRTVRVSLAAGYGLSAVAFADSRHGLAAEDDECDMRARARLFATADGGLAWRSLPTPPAGIESLGGAGRLWVAAIGYGDCGGPAIAISRNGGNSWAVNLPPHNWDCTPSVAPPERIWLACDAGLLTSDDAGRTWTQWTAHQLSFEDATPGWVIARNDRTGRQELWQETGGVLTERRPA